MESSSLDHDGTCSTTSHFHYYRDDDTRNTKSIVRNCSTNSKHLIEKGEGRVSQKTTGSLMGESI